MLSNLIRASESACFSRARHWHHACFGVEEVEATAAVAATFLPTMRSHLYPTSQVNVNSCDGYFKLTKHLLKFRICLNFLD